ncbi:helix-turn-helix domain-containing protein [Candidatus Peregrinibacteria bacterium]|nr:helix-turn-helix domain-containing protein [Candidatus Peregrinibacteria bacterium]
MDSTVLDEKFYTTDQVARILQIHPFTVLKFIKQGRLKGIKLGRVYRIMEKDINTFLEERMTQPKKNTKEKTKQEEKEITNNSSEEKEKNEAGRYYII